MSDESSSTERSRNIWAPWRTEYIETLAGDDDGCFLCRYRDETDSDEPNLVLWRRRRSFAVLNRFPYTGGHSLIAPYDHVGDLGEIERDDLCEIMELVRDVQRVLARAIRAEGFNIGINVGRCAGAGLPGHLHVHVVPRWAGDTNFMSVLGDVRVIPQSLQELYALLRRTGQEMNVPRPSAPQAG